MLTGDISIEPENLWVTIVTILFALSLISERIANLIKLHFSGLNLKKDNTKDEKNREKRISWLSLFTGLFVSLIAGADLFTLVTEGELYNHVNFVDEELLDQLKIIFGILFSALFVSLGSKFWHDVLDIVLQFSELKKYTAKSKGREIKDDEAKIVSDLILKRDIELNRELLKDKDAYEINLLAAYEFAKIKYLNKVWVTGVDIGFKYTNGIKTDIAAVRIHVNKKQANKIEIPESERVLPYINGIETDVIESNFTLTSTVDPKSKVEILQPGISIGDIHKNTGTLGLLVEHVDRKTLHLLTNAHVLKSADVFQPGLADGGSHPGDLVARIIDISVDRKVNLKGDMAIAEIVDSWKDKVLLEFVNTTEKIVDFRKAARGDKLKKVGKESDVTEGEVEGIGTYYIPNYGIKMEAFQIRAKNKKTVPGDSGSVWYDPQTKSGVGLHFSVTKEDDSLALACHLDAVLEEMNVTIK
ncbi:hypothetical protein [Reichenbachiella sp.]